MEFNLVKLLLEGLYIRVSPVSMGEIQREKIFTEGIRDRGGGNGQSQVVVPGGSVGTIHRDCGDVFRDRNCKETSKRLEKKFIQSVDLDSRLEFIVMYTAVLSLRVEPPEASIWIPPTPEDDETPSILLATMLIPPALTHREAWPGT